MEIFSRAARAAVSKKKRRFQRDGWDLDLSYITPRIIALGYPSSGWEAVYRNPIEEVEEFLSLHHGERCLVVNLCSERSYEETRFGGRQARFPFDDHSPPPLSLIAPFCERVQAWLEAHPRNVVAIHCKAGKGRAGVMIASLLLWQQAWPSASAAIDFFAQM